jgi:hypothetical protein
MFDIIVWILLYDLNVLFLMKCNFLASVMIL